MLQFYKHLLDENNLQQPKTALSTLDPVWIGGVGGSGTRVIAQLFSQLGFSSGDFTDVKTRDNIFWPPFKELLLSPAAKSNSRELIVANAFAVFEQLMNNSKDVIASPRNNWYSKVPVSFLMLPELAQYFPRMRYIHLVRNGLDMVFSKNILQAQNWGFYFGVVPNPIKYKGHGYSEEDLLDYWIRANEFAIRNGQECLGDRFMLLSFEAVCQDPETYVAKLLKFINEPVMDETVSALASLIKQPSSVNRYKDHDYKHLFTNEQIDTVRQYGYEIE